VSEASPQCTRSVLTEICLCQACSCPAIEDMGAPRGAGAGACRRRAGRALAPDGVLALNCIAPPRGMLHIEAAIVGAEPLGAGSIWCAGGICVVGVSCLAGIGWCMLALLTRCSRN
jgi:hypothetical protein